MYVPPLGILLCAWAINVVCSELRVADFFLSLIPQGTTPLLIPPAAFCMAALVALSTGTSWGTMAILIPMIMPLAYEMGGLELLIICAASILDGAVFGDHISPISDTTILSSMGSGCDHLVHVRTQLPYATFSFLIALGLGYFLVPLGLPLGGMYIIAFAAMGAILLVFGHKSEDLGGHERESSESEKSLKLKTT